jgi:general secretion pathway protein K
MRLRRTNRRRGVILIIVMIVLSGLSLLALGVSSRCLVETRLAQYQLDRAYAKQLAQAGVVLAIERLYEDRGTTDSLGEPWHGNLSLNGQRWLSDPALRYAGAQEVRVRCTDEDSRLNVNLSEPAALLALPGMTAEILAAVQDWRDADDDVRRGGAEKQYYLSIADPYLAKNKPLEIPSELLLVKGIDQAAYQGVSARTGLAAQSGQPSQPVQQVQQVQPGLRDYLTVYGNGKVNLNTAPLEVLRAIPGLSERSARRIVQVRDGPDGAPGTSDDRPFANLGEVTALCRLGEFETDVVNKFCKVNSEYFRIQSESSIAGGRVACRLEVVVHRVGDQIIPILCQEVLENE